MSLSPVKEMIQSLAYGVDPRRPEYYSLRQARYEALAADIDGWAAEAAREGKKLSVIDIGSGTGTCLRYLEAKPNFANIELSGADISDGDLYKKSAFKNFYLGDFMGGYPEIPANSYDVVICEQVLEHLTNIEVPIKTLARILKPGGRLIVGVPTFPPPFHLARKYGLPIYDRMMGRTKERGHVQSFSMFSFLRDMANYTSLKLVSVRGLRLFSGGLLRPLENHRWWWRAHRIFGEALPFMCVEIQAVMRKPV